MFFDPMSGFGAQPATFLVPLWKTVGCWRLLVANFGVRLCTTFPLPSHFASEVYLHPDFPRTWCFSTVNFKFCHCEAVDTLPVDFPPSIRFDPLDQPVINHSSFWFFESIKIYCLFCSLWFCNQVPHVKICRRQGWTESKMSRERFSRLGSVYHIPVQGMCSHNLFCRSCASRKLCKTAHGSTGKFRIQWRCPFFACFLDLF